MFLVQVQYFKTGTRYSLKISNQRGERFKTKSGQLWGVIPMFVEDTGEKMGGGIFAPCPLWIVLSRHVV